MSRIAKVGAVALTVVAVVSCGEDSWDVETDDTFEVSESASHEGCSPMGISDVRAVGYDPPHRPENSIDGNRGTRWAEYGYGAWIRYDLGTTRSLDAARIAFYRGGYRRAFFDISTSRDGSSYTRVWSGASGLGARSFDYRFPSISARYVRITVDGNTENNWAGIYEVELCAGGSTDAGTPPKPDAGTPRPDAGTPPKPDAGTPKPDAGTPRDGG
jgi:hypothetical protein